MTSSAFKVEENRVLADACSLRDGRRVRDAFKFEIISRPVPEMLEVDLGKMVTAEATRAYSMLRIPCIVEHAGLLFHEYAQASYPGGLTKPMWNTLGDRFLQETQSAGRRATARAVVGYCDGMTVHTFTGDTPGLLATAPRGSRAFYWDTVFIPDDSSGATAGRTYAEIVEDNALGLRYKVEKLSQSTKAMLAFLEYRLKVGLSPLWR